MGRTRPKGFIKSAKRVSIHSKAISIYCAHFSKKLYKYKNYLRFSLAKCTTGDNSQLVQGSDCEKNWLIAPQHTLEIGTLPAV